MLTTVLWGVTDGCPVCPGSGVIVCLKARITMELIFFCPLCGVAWPETPPPLVLDTVFALKELAPNGTLLPSQENIESAGLLKRLEILDNFDWLSFVEEDFDKIDSNSPRTEEGR